MEKRPRRLVWLCSGAVAAAGVALDACGQVGPPATEGVPPVVEVAPPADAAIPSCCKPLSRLGAIMAARPRGLRVEPIDGGTRVWLDGARLATYLEDTGRQPAVWPIVGPSGLAMTRQFPLGEKLPTEPDDHPHHESLWFAHGGVNGHDFWHGSGARIVHRGYDRREVDAAGVAVIATRNEWLGGGVPVLTDQRTLALGVQEASGTPAARFIDFTIRLVASQGDATFADTKEGTFAVRVPGTMAVDAGLGGRIENDRGQRNANAWGRAARWVDYHGPLAEPTGWADEAPTGGIAILTHPASQAPGRRWHVRTYGLFAANPFGVRDFPGGEDSPGPTWLRGGESLRLRYRAVFYAGEASPEEIEAWYNTFAAEPLGRYADSE